MIEYQADAVGPTSVFTPSLSLLMFDQVFHPGLLSLQPFLVGNEGATRTIVPLSKEIVSTATSPAMIHMRRVLIRHGKKLGLHLRDHIVARKEVLHTGQSLGLLADLPKNLEKL
jgi:hypothetical protein